MLTVAKVLAGSKRLPTISAAAVEIAKVIRDPRAGAAQIEAIVRVDPALAAEVLRLANSAVFKMPREVKSIRQAVALLGTKRLFDVATTAAFSRTIPDVLPGYRVDAAAYFSHCAAVAVISERLAAELRIAVSDMVFAAGLLHDLGKLAVGGFLEENQAALLDELGHAEEDLLHAEHSVLGVDHSEVGAALARSWNLPVEIEFVAAWHHKPTSSPSGSNATVDLIHAADVLAHLLGYGADVGGLARRVDVEATRRLGIKIQRLEAVAAQSLGEIAELTRMYRAQQNPPSPVPAGHPARR